MSHRCWFCHVPEGRYHHRWCLRLYWHLWVMRPLGLGPWRKRNRCISKHKAALGEDTHG